MGEPPANYGIMKMALSRVEAEELDCGCIDSIFVLWHKLQDINFVVKILQEHRID